MTIKKATRSRRGSREPLDEMTRLLVGLGCFGEAHPFFTIPEADELWRRHGAEFGGEDRSFLRLCFDELGIHTEADLQRAREIHADRTRLQNASTLAEKHRRWWRMCNPAATP